MMKLASEFTDLVHISTIYKFSKIIYGLQNRHLLGTDLESKLEWVESISNDSLRVSRVDFYRLTLNTIHKFHCRKPVPVIISKTVPQLFVSFNVVIMQFEL